MSEDAVRHAVAGMQQLHDGVWLTDMTPPSPWQLWWAATLTTADSALSHASAADCWGFLPYRKSPAFETIVRPGRRGPQDIGALHVSYSATLDGWVTSDPGFRITTPARTIVDLGGVLGERHVIRMVREALRLERLTVAELQVALVAHRGRRGIRLLNELAARYARLRLEETRSDAEAYALELLAAAGVPEPGVNIEIAGEEADLSWPEHRLIIEIDGPSWHQYFDAENDARKQAAWEAAGWRVERLPSDEVYERPHRLLALAPQPNVHAPVL